jgi:hypothetical protein
LINFDGSGNLLRLVVDIYYPIAATRKWILGIKLLILIFQVYGDAIPFDMRPELGLIILGVGFGIKKIRNRNNHE